MLHSRSYTLNILSDIFRAKYVFDRVWISKEEPLTIWLHGYYYSYKDEDAIGT